MKVLAAAGQFVVLLVPLWAPSIATAEPSAPPAAVREAAAAVTVKGWDPYLKADLELTILPSDASGRFTGKFSDLRAQQTMNVTGTITPEVLRFTGVDWVGKKPWLATGKPAQFSAELPRAGGKYVGKYNWNGSKGDFEFRVPPGTADANASAVPTLNESKSGIVAALEQVNKGVDGMARAAQAGSDRVAGRATNTTAPSGGSTEQPRPSSGFIPTFSTEAFTPGDFEEVKELFVSSIRHKPITLAPPLDGSVDAPAGLHWGLSIDELVAGLKNRGAVLEQKTKEAGKTVVTLRGGSFGGQTVDLWTASFVDSGLFELSIQFYSATSDTMNIFRTVQKSLVGKYGKPNVIQDHGFSRLNLNADYSERLHDYYAADGRFWRALNNLQADYAHGVANDALQVVARWAYKNSDKITLHAVGNSDVLLVYTNGVGASQKSSVNAAEAAKDF